jgi:hypothetical protein
MLQKAGIPFIRINNIGSRGDGCTIYHLKKGIFIRSGCWFGTVEDFETRVKNVHGDTVYAKQYLLALELAKVTFGE